MVEQGKEERVRPTVNIGSGGNTAFADMKDLEPRNEMIAVVGGATVGAAIPAILIGAGNSKVLSEVSKHLSEGAFKDGLQAAKGISGGKTAVAIVAASAALGAVLAYLPTRTHNKWSDRVASRTLDNQQSQGAAR